MANALTFPLPLADFFAGLEISTMPFDLSESLVSSQTGGGEIITADNGPRLWQGSVSVAPNYHVPMRQVEALAQTLRQGGRSFFVTDTTAGYPASDPDGTTLGAATPAIASLDADNKRLTIDGLPAGYVLTRGDMLSFTYGSSPTRYALHQIVTSSVTADGAGLTPLFEVVPFIRPGAAVNAAVTLIQPYCKAVLVPGSYSGGTRDPAVTSGFSFSFRQTLR